ncbi:phage infection protein [Mesorhizobium sp. M7A.F.Ca.US.007.01.2.1]|uniref:phage infection protein n=1 Tax=Mesorhizobium sp. M7A.F.Ca.US.007.01.2.1 TaxID=2496711 RepID=UPI000FCA7752|nr:phage infection protein [Mesorhizobium sp. M7A.F.Ca.US.007.01.2.1]RUZ29382.1 phage infection protein [Mesorhizobium sp. M7A.F.Ca.US.007.01.2.1]
MNKLLLNLENCYGIKKLKADLDFSNTNAIAIYAPNGAMKSSLAKTFQDIADGKSSGDRIFKDRINKRVVSDEKGVALSPESIMVVLPYEEAFGHSEKTSTLLVNSKLREEYEKLNLGFEDARQRLLAALKQHTGSKKDLGREISSTFTPGGDQFYKALLRVQDELMKQKTAPFAMVKYDVIFDDKVLALLDNANVKASIENYIKQYNQLIAKSTYFRKGTFTYYNASEITKNLADNGFFKAKHSINFNSGAKLEITTEQQLKELVDKEKEAINNDPDLRKKFAAVEKLITKNVNVRQFETYLTDNEDLLPHLASMPAFKEEVWKSYLFTFLDLYKDVIEKYQAAEKRRGEIEAEAAKERTQWADVIEIFNDRFFVPFKLVPKNFTEVVLGREPILSVGFTFEDGADTASVEHADLLATLSTGEKKALYILNIIFDIRVRQEAGQATFMVVDDVADSFDYKNKYAIIQYLKDVAEGDGFQQVILTHNFDFFRTIKSRFVGYGNCLMVSRNSDGITLAKAAGIDNVFVNDWKAHFFNDSKKRIASVPFMRNLIEFTKGDGDAGYLTLNSLLHWRADTASTTEAELDEIYQGLFGLGQKPVDDRTGSVVNGIYAAASECLVAPDGANFEHKIVLSIAIRLKAEEFMAGKINDPSFLASISQNQTPKLLKRYTAQFSGDPSVKVLDKVVLMTPENIHLNAFMYEPILDMSDEHLRKLYGEVVALA